jgi:hypothetical protein
MSVKRSRWATVLGAVLALSCGGTASTPAQGSKARDGGAKAPGTKDGGKAGATDAGAPDASKGDAGSSVSGQDASTAQGPLKAGDFNSIWKRYSSDITVVDPAVPSGVVQKTVELPPTLIDPADGREVDMYQQVQVKDGMLLTYAHFDGDEVYYQISAPLTGSDPVYVGSGSDHFILELTDGQLIETRTSMYGAASANTRTTYSAHTGSFPPSGWPSQKLVVP